MNAAMKGKTLHTVGIEYDAQGIRAVKVSADTSDYPPDYKAIEAAETRGDFTKDKELVEGLKKIKKKVDLGMYDRVVTSISGKQTFVTEMPFKDLADTDLRNALKLEIRKKISFDAMNASIDAQKVHDAEEQGGDATFLVAAAADECIDTHLTLLEKADIKAQIVELLPVTLLNAYWAIAPKKPKAHTAYAVIHLSPEACTLVITGKDVPFFTRTIYISGDELFGPKKKSLSARDHDQKLTTFGTELHRSLAFYEKTNDHVAFAAAYVCGEYVHSGEVLDHVEKHSGVHTAHLALTEKISQTEKVKKGKFDCAMSSALRID